MLTTGLQGYSFHRGPEVMTPAKPTQLYRHYAADGGLLYVGVSTDAVARLKAHSTWKADVARSEIRNYPSRGEALAAEAEAIRTELPRFNRNHASATTKQKQVGMTSAEYGRAIAALGLTQGQAAKFLDISIRTSNRYANGRPVPGYIAKLLRLMIRLKLKPEDVT